MANAGGTIEEQAVAYREFYPDIVAAVESSR
jgi:hypothetical protein